MTVNIGLKNIYSYEKYKIVLKNVYFNSNYCDFISNYGDNQVIFLQVLLKNCDFEQAVSERRP